MKVFWWLDGGEALNLDYVIRVRFFADWAALDFRGFGCLQVTGQEAMDRLREALGDVPKPKVEGTPS